MTIKVVICLVGCSNRSPTERKLRIESGWTEKQQYVYPDVRMFYGFRDQLSIHDNIIYKEEKVIVPASLQMDYVRKLHTVTVEKTVPRREAVIFSIGQLQPVILTNMLTDVRYVTVISHHNRRNH